MFGYSQYEVIATTNGTEANLAQHLATLNNQGTITIKANFTITSNFTIPSGIELNFFKGNYIIVATGVTLTINGSIKSGLNQIFDVQGTGSIAGNPQVQYIYPQWFGASGTNTNDCTTAMQKAVDLVQKQPGGILYIPKGTYSISSLIISDVITVLGEANYQIANLRTYPTGITLADLPKTTILIHTSQTLPLFKILIPDASTVSGVKISGLVFYQNHGTNYSNLATYNSANYPYLIDDTSSPWFFSGLIVENCMFANIFKGIKLTKAARFHIDKICGDVFHNFLYVVFVKDVSHLTDIHIWNFSQSSIAAAYARSVNSDYVIKADDVDEFFMDRIFIWDHKKGMHLKNIWGKLSKYTADAVGKALVIENAKPFSFVADEIAINSSSSDAVVDAAISIIGSTTTTIGLNPPLLSRADNMIDVTLANVSVWTGLDQDLRKYAYNSAILIDDPYVNLKLTNTNLKYALNEGVFIKNAKYVNLNGINFSNFFPNQGEEFYKIGTVGIRNETPTAYVEISNLYNSSVLKFIYDGYSDRLTAPKKKNILHDAINYNKFHTWTESNAFYAKQLGTYHYHIESTVQHPVDWQGIKDNYVDNLSVELESGNYIYGATYYTYTGLTMFGNTSNDTRIFNLALSNGSTSTQIHLPINIGVTATWRTSIISLPVTTSRLLAPSVYGRNFTGVFLVNNTFLIKSNSFHLPE